MTLSPHFKCRFLTLGILGVLAAITLGQGTAHGGPPPSGMPVAIPALNLDSNPGGESNPQSVRLDQKTAITLILILLSMTGIVLAAYILGRQHHSQTPYLAPTAFPFSAKLGLSFLLLIYAITHGIAALTVYLNTRVIYTSAQEYFFYIKPARLTGLSHAHLMGIATMDGLVAFLYALTRPSTGFTAAIVTATFAGIFLDIASWWAIKYLGGGYEPLSMISGILFSGGFLMMSFAILHGMWLGTQKRMEL